MGRFFTVSTLFVTLTACAHRLPADHGLPAFGFHGYIHAHRAVVCLGDNDMTPERCEDVTRAAAKINAAVGFELLQPPQYVPMTSMPEYKPESEVILVGVDRLAPGTLGETRVQLYETGDGALRAELIIYAPLIWQDPLANPGMLEGVLLHELTHACGAGHAEQRGVIESVMRPGWRPGAPVDLTANDLAALRAAYN